MMRGHKNRIERLNKSVPEPEKLTLLVEYKDGRREGDLPLDAELSEDAERVMVFNGDKPLSQWWLADLWTSLQP